MGKQSPSWIIISALLVPHSTRGCKQCWDLGKPQYAPSVNRTPELVAVYELGKPGDHGLAPLVVRLGKQHLPGDREHKGEETH